MNTSETLIVDIIQKLDFVREFKKQYDNNIVDRSRILFYVENYEGITYFMENPRGPIEYTNYAGVPIPPDVNENGSENEKTLIKKENGIEYINQVNLEYLTRTQNGETIKILYENDIVYPCESINILFDYPMMDAIMLKCQANEIEKGFTNKELIEKVLKYYRMIQKMHYYYNFDDGTFSSAKMVDQKLFHTCMGDYLYDINIVGLIYDKKTNVWTVEFDDYV